MTPEEQRTGVLQVSCLPIKTLCTSTLGTILSAAPSVDAVSLPFVLFVPARDYTLLARPRAQSCCGVSSMILRAVGDIKCSSLENIKNRNLSLANDVRCCKRWFVYVCHSALSHIDKEAPPWVKALIRHHLCSELTRLSAPGGSSSHSDVLSTSERSTEFDQCQSTSAKIQRSPILVTLYPSATFFFFSAVLR